jgi:hypothetical protein
MPGVDSEFGAALLRLWIAAGSAALLLLLCVLAYFQAKRLAANPALRAGVVVAGAFFGALMTWASMDRAIVGGAAADRRALELRAQELSAQVLQPGSALACLDSLAGESVAAACEKALFASPAAVASASAFIAAQLTLLTNMTAFAGRDGAGLEASVTPLRRALETDRFGFVAYVLATRDGCSAQKCKALSLFRDANRVRTNLTNATVERYLEHYAPAWNAASEVPLAEATQAPPAAMTAGQPTHKVVNIDFPTAASIPAVSIMNPEPNGPVLPGVAAARAADPNGQPAKHARKAAPAPNPNAAAAAAPPSSPPAVDPIWPEPMPAAPAGAPTAAAAAPANTGPVQLTPPPVNASAATAPRAQ